MICESCGIDIPENFLEAMSNACKGTRPLHNCVPIPGFKFTGPKSLEVEFRIGDILHVAGERFQYLSDGFKTTALIEHVLDYSNSSLTFYAGEINFEESFTDHEGFVALEFRSAKLTAREIANSISIIPES